MSIISPHSRTAVVLFNLGGPDAPESVQPFLFNLFSDPAIIRLPKFLRSPLASFISRRREATAKAIYEEMGGKSPIVENTEQQGKALELSLSAHGEVKVFHAMRYWHPQAQEVAAKVKEYGPQSIILLPLYPQFSTTTTASSFAEWKRAATAIGLQVKTHEVCCYPTQPQFITAHAQLVRTYVGEASRFGTPRVLFSAHGLPKSIVKRGDPYQWQVEATARAIATEVAVPGLDTVVCYQSRVGPMRWLEPSIRDEILRAAKDKVPLVVVPIAFVSEHSETLVELDIEYADLAHARGIDRYYRVPALSVQAHFIAGLADLCLKFPEERAIASHTGARFCAMNWKECPCRT
ncbi:MAG: ferrochelatase [Alphaproteobacteria bacterium]